MSKSQYTRRAFMVKSAGVAGAVATAKTVVLRDDRLEAASYSAAAPSDRVRFGIIGIGMQGSGLLASAVTASRRRVRRGLRSLRRPPHARQGNRRQSESVTTRNYQELLDHKDIDCLIAAVPDHWHMRVVVDAVSAGKDIYCEKPMSHTAAEGIAMVDAQKKTGRIVQIGSQRVSSVICAKAKELIAQGIIGDLTLVEGSLGRNDPTGAWEYPPPPDLSPQTLDWDTWQNDVAEGARSIAKIFARWRCWKEYGTGVAGDLLVHLVSGMNYMLGWNEPPRRAMALGGILRLPDGRNMPDVHADALRLRNGSRLSAAESWLRDAGNVSLPGLQGNPGSHRNGISYFPQTGEDSAPSYYAIGFPKELREAYFKQWHEEHDPPPGKEPSLEGSAIVAFPGTT